jgi:hypothetical protein
MATRYQLEWCLNWVGSIGPYWIVKESRKRGEMKGKGKEGKEEKRGFNSPLILCQLMKYH